MGDQRGTRFDVLEVAALTGDIVDAVLDRVAGGTRLPQLVVYGRSSPSGRERLREAGLSYAGADGRILLQRPRLYVDRDRPDERSDPSLGWSGATGVDLPRNPFAVRGSRVARWLLLHPEQSFAISELAAHVELSVAAVSRAVQALDELAVVQTAATVGDARGREVRLSRATGLLDAWLPVWQRRRVRRTVWDVGTSSVESAIKLMASAAAEQEVAWVLGGLAGAAKVNRAVEPADALVWIDADDLPRLAKSLMPERSRGGRGAVRVAAAPDPWTLGLARERRKLPVADPVQLWLDCSSEGERALEAADAVAKEMGW
ncbi:hypothetical protein [Baekduia sp.]|uniref:hypothetical protein n=1 Tax=Baekduia sp. TaxID=2600305 RepID=UPI002E0C85E2|nr:hypothetical protein [Baekduia sp.]